VTQKYGREKVAQIITRHHEAKAVRDVGRVLEMSFADVDKVAKQIPPALDMTLDKALEESETRRQMEQDDPKVKELLSVARRLEGMTRHASVHAAGVVIAPKAITEHAALQRGPRRNRDPVVDEGDRARRALKMDFLGLSTLDADLRRHPGDQADHRRRARHRHRAARRCQDLSDLPGRRADVRHLPVREQRHARHPAEVEAAARLDDLIALNARTVRARCAAAWSTTTSRASRARPRSGASCGARADSADTYGVIAYQEQVMRISNVVAGFTLGEADLLRKAMGKKNAEVMAKMRGKFVEGAKKLGTGKEGRAAVDLMAHFSPATASTSRTRPPTRSWRIRPPT
jgi:DNA polymerase-3 subunit alpha